MLIEEQLKKYGIKSASMISEGTFKPRLIINNLDETEYIYDVYGIISIDSLTNKLNKHFNTVCIKKNQN